MYTYRVALKGEAPLNHLHRQLREGNRFVEGEVLCLECDSTADVSPIATCPAYDIICFLLLSRAGKEDYLYLDAIRFIKSLKKGAAFGECCPMLNDISHLPSWKRVNAGMQRLYEGVVILHVFITCSLSPRWHLASFPPYSECHRLSGLCRS